MADDVLDLATWKRPDLRSEGSKNHAVVYEAVGFATTTWEFLEEALSELFCVFAGTRDKSVRRAYGSIFSTHGRRTAILAAAAPHFGHYWDSKPVKAATTSLINITAEASKRRDEIVHGIAMGFSLPDKIGTAKNGVPLIELREAGVFLQPPGYNTGYTSPNYTLDELEMFSNIQYRYTGEDILTIAHRFGELTKAVKQHTDDCRKAPDGTIPIVERLIAEGRVTRIAQE